MTVILDIAKTARKVVKMEEPYNTKLKTVTLLSLLLDIAT